MSRILFTHQTGDALALECFFPAPLRASLTEVVWATRRGRDLAGLFGCLPRAAFPALERQTVLDADWARRWSYMTLGQVKQDFPALDWGGVEDWTPYERFPKIRAGLTGETGSSFLKYAVAERPAGLPARYYVTQAHTTQNADGERRVRDFTARDWWGLIGRLKGAGAPAVLLDRDRTAEAPPSEWLIDWRGKTTLAESVEILKGASGYLGIDSWLSVLACRLFNPPDLVVRSRNPQYLAERRVYTGREDVGGFVVREMGSS